MTEHITIRSISEAHRFLGIDKPAHPLVTVFRHRPEMQQSFQGVSIRCDLYIISMKDGVSGTLVYGRNSYDFEEGTMVFIAPGQELTAGQESDSPPDDRGWTLLFHPDLIGRSNLARALERYSFFGYSVSEALHLSEREKQTLTELSRKIEDEIHQNMDQHSEKLIVSNIELLLDYCTRYYDRQFYTRSSSQGDVLARFEAVLREYFKSEKQLEQGIPSVKYCGDQMFMSPNYLSDLLKKETGRAALDHIHGFIIERAKTNLLNSNESIGYIAFGLGFQHSQHFSKLFKAKTGMSPREYRSLN